MLNNNWIFGERGGVSFANNTTSTLANAAITTPEGCASISDENGNLLMYTDGVSVWDGSHTLRIHNLNLSGNATSTQSAIIVPDPRSSTRYCIFTVGSHLSGANNYAGTRLMGTSIDLLSPTWAQANFDTAAGVPALSTPQFTERLTAVAMPDCQGYWILTTVRSSKENLLGTSNVTDTNARTNYGEFQGNGILRIYRLNSTGLAHHADFALRTGATNVKISHAGYLRVSPDGRKIAMANGLLENLLLLDFDRTFGIPSNLRVAPLNRATIAAFDSRYTTDFDLTLYGVEFSPDSRQLYFSAITHHAGSLSAAGDPQQVTGPSGTQIWAVRGFILRMAWNDPGFAQSVLVGEDAGVGGYTFGALQLGPDGLIYVARHLEKNLGVITNANTVGSYSPTGPNVGGTCGLGLPNLLPNPCESGDDCDCGCGCSGCNDHEGDLAGVLIDRAEARAFDFGPRGQEVVSPFDGVRCNNALRDVELGLRFFLSWGDTATDVIRPTGSEVFYLTVVNPFADLEYKGIRIKQVRLTPNVPNLANLQIVPDRLVHIDCLHPCSRASREFAIIGRNRAVAGTYEMVVDFCVDEVVVHEADLEGSVRFALEIRA